MSIVIESSCVDAFEHLMQSEITPALVHDFLRIPSFNKMISACGRCVGIKDGDFATWETLMLHALNNLDCALVNEGIYYKNIYNAFQAAGNDLPRLKQNLATVKDLLETYDFVAIAHRYLPGIQREGSITASLMFGLSNCFAPPGDRMYLDVNFLAGMPTALINGIVAHEYHHMLRENVLNQKAMKTRHRKTYGDLRMLECEAIADMCNGFEKSLWFYEELGFISRKEMLSRLENYKNIFAEFETLFCEQPKKLHGFLFSHNLNLHLIGHCMATTIQENLGTECLAACVGDCIQFLTAFQEASKANSQPYGYVFSEAFMKKLAKIAN